MSKKNKNKLSKNIDETDKKETKEVIEKEPLSKGEKIFHTILFSVGGLLILLIIIFSIGTGGDKNMIARKYNSITNENVFEMLDYEELVAKIDNKETFQVLVINNTQHEANYYIYCVNEIVTQMNEENIKNGSSEEQAIYVLDPVYLEKEEQKIFKEIDKSILEEPSLVLFGHNEDTIGDKSVELNSTDRYFIEDFSGNSWNLLVKYFKDCENE